MPIGKEKQIENIEVSAIYLAISFLLRKDIAPKYSPEESAHIKSSNEVKLMDGCEELVSDESFDYKKYVETNVKWWKKLGVSESQIVGN